MISKKQGKAKKPNGTYVEFLPDEEIFGESACNEE